MLTPNQVVACNLAKARALRGWTQEEAAKKLEPILKVRWSKATFSAAERSVAGKRVRQFSADEIAAFALAFRLPVGWFFLPPETDGEGPLPDMGLPLGDTDSEAVRRRAHAGYALPPALSLALVLSTQEMEERVSKLLTRLPPGVRAKYQRSVKESAESATAAMFKGAVGDLRQWQQSLRSVADFLGTMLQKSVAEARLDLSKDREAAPKAPRGRPRRREGPK